MEKENNIKINRLTRPVPESRLDDMRSLMEYHDTPMILAAMLRYMPDTEYRRMVEDLNYSNEVLLEERAIFEEGGLPGRGALKILVSKSPEQNLEAAECQKIGRIIASMQGEPRKYYVGMINFLKAACKISGLIWDSYREAAIANADKMHPPEQVPDVVNRLFPGKTMPTPEEIKKKEAEESKRLKELNKKAKTQAKEQETNEPPTRTRAPRESSLGMQKTPWTDRTKMMQRGQNPQTQEEAQEEAVAPSKPVKPKQAKSKTAFKQYVPQLSVVKPGQPQEDESQVEETNF